MSDKERIEEKKLNISKPRSQTLVLQNLFNINLDESDSVNFTFILKYIQINTSIFGNGAI